MKSMIVFVLTLASSPVFAQTSVNVIIDGRTYSCSEGGTADCGSQVQLMKSKYAACKASYGAGYCFDSGIKGKVVKTCAPAVEFCNTACKESYGAGYCYDTCY